MRCKTVTSRFFKTSDGVRLHYLEAGAGRTIVFVPGWTMPAEIWRFQLEHLARKFGTVSLDLRSQGQSEGSQHPNSPERRARDVVELITHLNRGPVVAVGWSMGAVEVLNCVDQFGTAGISGLVLIDAFLVQPDWMKDEIVRMSVDLRNDRVGATERYVRQMYKKPQEESYISNLVNACLRTPTDTAIALMESFLRQTDWRSALAKLDKPLLYIAQEGLRHEAHLLTENFPGAQVEIFETAGHALFIEEALRFNAVLESFIENRCD